MNEEIVSIVIPCLNEQNTIEGVIKDAKKNASLCFHHKYEIIVADNGSTDGSVDIIKKYKSVRLVNVPVRGYGAALHWGIISAKGEMVIFADADQSYPFSNLKKFKEQIDQNLDLVLGSRMRGSIQKNAMPFLHRYLGTPILTFLVNVIYGINTTDCNSGMRMIKKSFYKKLNMRNSGMEWASEMLCKTALQHGNYLEVPIKFFKDKRGEKPHLSMWSDGWRHLKAIFLIKPQSLCVFLAILGILASIFYRRVFSLSFFFADLFVVLGLSMATLELLGALINKKKTTVSHFLLQFKLVPLTIGVALAVGVSIPFIPDERNGTRLFLISIVGIMLMWLFLIETIKTHLANRLPDLK